MSIFSRIRLFSAQIPNRKPCRSGLGFTRLVTSTEEYEQRRNMPGHGTTRTRYRRTYLHNTCQYKYFASESDMRCSEQANRSDKILCCSTYPHTVGNTYKNTIFRMHAKGRYKESNKFVVPICNLYGNNHHYNHKSASI
jgi:hypothetical protein